MATNENSRTPTKGSDILSQWERDTEKKRETEEMNLGRTPDSKKKATLEKEDLYSGSPSGEWKMKGAGLQDVSNGRGGERGFGGEDVVMGGTGIGKEEKYKENKKPKPGYGSIFAADTLPVQSKAKTDREMKLDDSKGDGGKNKGGKKKGGKEDKKDAAPATSSFILDLMAKHPEMSERVNAAPKRRTAMDMWDDPKVTKSFD